MAGVPEKARYYLELSVPQLREWESKSIFSSAEIRSLVRKRTDFEHLVLSPGSTPAEWKAYIDWERSLETLRAKRCKRMQIRNSSSHTGQGRIFGIFDRAVGRHPSSVDLWKAYLGYAQEAKATKRWRKVVTRAIRMHPAKPELWVIAGRRSAGNGDMQAARAFFMRGARFCTRDAILWLEYARCELEWLQRMEARKNKKGGVLRAIEEQKEGNSDDMIALPDGDSDEDMDEDGRLILPDPDNHQAVKAISDETAKKLENNPALDGAIPQAIFDIARKQSFFKPVVAEQFFSLLAEFNEVSSQARLAQHILDVLQEIDSSDPSTCSCLVRQPLLGLNAAMAAYPKALRESLARLKAALSSTSNRPQLAQKVKAWIEPILSTDELDPGIRTVLEHTLSTLPTS